MERTTIFLPLETKLALQAAAARTGRSRAEIIRLALNAYLDGIERPDSALFGSVEDGSLVAADYEDWLAANWNPLDHD